MKEPIMFVQGQLILSLAYGTNSYIYLKNLPDVMTRHRFTIDKSSSGSLHNLEAQICSRHELKHHVQHTLTEMRKMVNSKVEGLFVGCWPNPLQIQIWCFVTKHCNAELTIGLNHKVKSLHYCCGWYILLHFTENWKVEIAIV